MKSNLVSESQGHMNVKAKAFQTDFYVHIGYYSMTKVYKSLTGKTNSFYWL